MRSFRKTCLLFLLIYLLSSFGAADEKIFIESCLLKGIREVKNTNAEVVIASFSEPFLVFIHPKKIESEREFISHLKRELYDIYQLKNVELFVTGRLIWDGKKSNLNELIILRDFYYLINLFPKILPDNKINMRIEIDQFRASEVSPDARVARTAGKEKYQEGILLDSKEIVVSDAPGEEVLNTAIVMNCDEPVVLGFPSNGIPYFLSILVTRKDLNGFLSETGDKAQGEAKREIYGGVYGGVVGGGILASIRDTDPVCGKIVGRGAGFEKEKRALKYEYKGKAYMFCSAECLEKFKKDPERYIIKDAGKAENTAKIREETTLVEGDILPPRPVLHVKPVYPEKCKAKKIEGLVILMVTIDKEGNVVDAQILKSLHPDLDKAAQEALKQWKYEPVLKNGKPISVAFVLTINFALSEVMKEK